MTSRKEVVQRPFEWMPSSFEEVRDGYVMVVKHGAWGEADIVTLV